MYIDLIKILTILRDTPPCTTNIKGWFLGDIMPGSHILPCHLPCRALVKLLTSLPILKRIVLVDSGVPRLLVLNEIQFVYI